MTDIPPGRSLVPSAGNPPAVDAERGWAMHTSPTVQSSRTLVILGEAPGADEEKVGIPFVGAAGKQLSESMAQAGLDRREWHILNTFLQRPPNNDLSHPDWTLNKTEFKKEYGYVPSGAPLKKRFLRPEHQWQVAELHQRLAALRPDLILAMGATALWALTGESAISQWRGNFFASPFGRAIATLHPASVLYQYSNMPLLWADLSKTRLWLSGELPPPLKRRLWVNPTFAEIEAVYNRFRFRRVNRRDPMGVDIETAPGLGQITMVGFGFADEGICIPIWNKHAYKEELQNYWPTAEEETKAWRWIKAFCDLSHFKVMQNGLYDSQYFLDAPIQIRLKNWRDDTAVLQHSYQPELPKALGTLSSLYLNEPSWKQMRLSAKDVNKADD